MSFQRKSLSSQMVNKLERMGIKELFKVQEDSFDAIYDGYDVMIQSRTGSGKTLAFGIPIVERLLASDCRPNGITLLALAPTRELAQQICNELEKISNLQVLCVYGGSDIGQQISRLRYGVDMVVGTPGRVGDLLQRKVLILDSIQHMVLDEVDRMLDMGFKDSVENIINNAFGSTPNKPQLVMLSATLPTWVFEAAELYMYSNYIKIDTVDTEERTAVSVKHEAINPKDKTLVESINSVVKAKTSENGRVIIFAETKRQVHDIWADRNIDFPLEILHGDVEQYRREQALKAFRDGTVRAIVCTDVASRGIDIPNVELVIQCSPPKDPDNYIHRSGRTGRAGRCGLSVLFYSRFDEYLLGQIERRAGIKFEESGLPSPEEVLFNNVMSKINAVPEDKMSRYLPIANRLMSCDHTGELLAALVSLVVLDEPVHSPISRGSSYTSVSTNNNFQNDRRSSFKPDSSRRPRDYFANSSSKTLNWERGSNFAFK